MTDIASIVRAGYPDASHLVIDTVLWGCTPFPAGQVTAKTLYKAASGYYRSRQNGIELCLGCSNKVAKVGDLCSSCARNNYLIT